jgi:tRNA uridine 5-carboxymethylaminomethyl modification enzyme
LKDDEILSLETAVKYEGYISRQMIEVNRFKKVEKRRIPENIEYHKILGISREAKDKLSKIRPASIGQASRIPGLSMCDLSLLAVYIQKINAAS